MSRRYASSSRTWPTTTCSSAAARGGWTRLSRPFWTPVSRLRTSTSNVSPTNRPCRDLPSRESHATYRLRHLVHRSEEHTSELQSLRHLVCRLLLEKSET